MTNKEAKITLIQYSDDCADMPDYEVTAEACKVAIKALEQTMWIPINEKLPEKYMNCLITVKTEAYFCTPHYEVYIAWFDGENFIYEYGNKSIVAKISIIAWMSLPDPYKSESEETYE